MGEKCYGKLEPRIPAKAPRLASYLGDAQVEFPPACHWYGAVDHYDVLLNDRLGDCVVAAVLHQQQAWCANTGRSFTPTDAQALTEYEALSGYDPVSGTNDNGVDETACLTRWASVGIAGNRCAAHCVIDPTNISHLKLAIYLFGGVLVGTQVTAAVEQQTDQGQPWHDSWWPSIVVGLHGIPLLGYDEQYLYAVSWGVVVSILPQYAIRRFDEAHAVVDTEWVNAQGVSPSGFNFDQLLADQAQVSR